MTKQALHISPDLSLPLDAITQTFGVLAVRGAGKSNLAAAMAEEMYLAHLPFVVIDPVGSWYGLRARGDGKGEGLAIPIFGGRHGDAALERTGGQLIADLVVDHRMTCVLDVSEFSEGDKIRFLIDFAERLYRRNTEPLHLFLEEADDYAPQRPMREQARLLGAWQNIVRRGRARGLGITMITQRSAVLNKDVLTQIETLFVLRTTSPQDRAAIEAWVKYQGAAAEMLKTLPTLEAGEAWVWSPSWLKTFKRVHVRRRWTFDSGATPKGGKASKPATLADVDLGAIREQMAATIERAKADDPRELRKRIAELEREVKAKAAPEVKHVPALTPGECKRLGHAVEQLEKITGTLRDALGITLRPVERMTFDGERKPTLHRAPPAAATAPLASGKKAPASTSNGHTPLGNSGMRRMLVALCQAGKPLTPSQIAIRTSIARRGGTFRTYVGKLLTDGLVERDGERLVATGAGAAALGDVVELLPTGRDLLEHWIGELGSSGAARMLRAIGDAHPRKLTREQLGAATDIAVAGGTFRTYLGKLKTLELVDDDRGELGLGSDLV